mmetsp:Transcript_15110/g.33532  ORF Transcript_15110/g.33532 Transcript_15110/m.33532 type:complete len:362 (-) Transcript_15110:764-1849(-)
MDPPVRMRRQGRRLPAESACHSAAHVWVHPCVVHQAETLGVIFPSFHDLEHHAAEGVIVLVIIRVHPMHDRILSHSGQVRLHGAGLLIGILLQQRLVHLDERYLLEPIVDVLLLWHRLETMEDHLMELAGHGAKELPRILVLRRKECLVGVDAKKPVEAVAVSISHGVLHDEGLQCLRVLLLLIKIDNTSAPRIVASAEEEAGGSPLVCPPVTVAAVHLHIAAPCPKTARLRCQLQGSRDGVLLRGIAGPHKEESHALEAHAVVVAHKAPKGRSADALHDRRHAESLGCGEDASLVPERSCWQPLCRVIAWRPVPSAEPTVLELLPRQGPEETIGRVSQAEPRSAQERVGIRPFIAFHLFR